MFSLDPIINLTAYKFDMVETHTLQKILFFKGKNQSITLNLLKFLPMILKHNPHKKLK
jgi:hypothetical protein